MITAKRRDSGIVSFEWEYSFDACIDPDYNEPYIISWPIRIDVEVYDVNKPPHRVSAVIMVSKWDEIIDVVKNELVIILEANTPNRTGCMARLVSIEILGNSIRLSQSVAKNINDWSKGGSDG